MNLTITDKNLPSKLKCFLAVKRAQNFKASPWEVHVNNHIHVAC